ncbi:ribose-5-phosphate isomerase [Candidatus Pacearchaeota archaeon]|jgi:ribose 5-phosphate isomerase B|nr:ribose-5-phosphate isomerase [Candidatus Pacearchaeota archaeon]|tara:strand:+ start:43 stop:498 length:456 start_codon:yes stop_codon:yes gene_type:complete
MVIYLAGDHAGFRLKRKIIDYFIGEGIKYDDLGPLDYDEKDDYPDYVVPLARKVAKGKRGKDFGIAVCGSGQGEAIAVNKIRGVRCALYYGGPVKMVKLSKEHNDANVLSLGARFLSEKEAIRAVDIWLKSRFEGGRHLRRLKKISGLGGK